MSDVCPTSCPRDDEIHRLVGELSILVDFIRQQCALIMATPALEANGV